MERILIDDQDVIIECPSCDSWEIIHVDEPRKRLAELPIIKWEPDVEGQNEVSINQCIDCKTTFKLEWDYNNIIK